MYMNVELIKHKAKSFYVLTMLSIHSFCKNSSLFRIQSWTRTLLAQNALINELPIRNRQTLGIFKPDLSQTFHGCNFWSVRQAYFLHINKFEYRYRNQIDDIFSRFKEKLPRWPNKVDFDKTCFASLWVWQIRNGPTFIKPYKVFQYPTGNVEALLLSNWESQQAE